MVATVARGANPARPRAMEGMNRFVIPVLVVVAAVAGAAAVAIAMTDRPAGATVPRKPIAGDAGSYPLSTLTVRSVRRTGPKVASVQQARGFPSFDQVPLARDDDRPGS